MKKIFESEWVFHDDYSQQVTVFQFENEDEYWEFSTMNHMEKCEYFGVFDTSGYEVAPGAMGYSYDFNYNSSFVTMTETQSLNV
jgi:hypothetical protein